MSIELEKTYLAKYLPNDLDHCKSEEIIDIYIPKSVEHPNLRIRKKGDNLEITKKYPVSGGDASRQHEHTIELNKQEFEALTKDINGKKVRKYRYYYNSKGKVIEIDRFQDALLGLVLVDIEFTNENEQKLYPMPDFCLAEVTQEKPLAGGLIVGKTYQQIEPTLAKYGYKPLYLID
jgi:CYTH domain-containing protein